MATCDSDPGSGPGDTGDSWLGAVLHSGSPDRPLPAGFERRVLYRMCMDTADDTPPAIVGWMRRLWSPLPMMAALMVAVSAGAAAGWHHGHSLRLKREEARYLASLDPTHHFCIP